MNELDVLRASGGLVYRPGRAGPEVLVVHRPRYDDWSLPKGKDEPEETAEQAALREVLEETGQRARILHPLAEVSYPVRGQEKVVTFFVMRHVGDAGFEPTEEVDEIRWLTVPAALDLLTYERDRDLVSLAEPPAPCGTVWLVRHAHAGDRRSWLDDDRLRPVSPKGADQSKAIAVTLGSRGVDRIVSSAYLRCVQTVEPLAAATSLEIETLDSLAEGADATPLLAVLAETAGLNLVLCSHGDVIPELIEHLARRGTELHSPTGMVEYKKASIWEITVEDGIPSTAVYIPPPAL